MSVGKHNPETSLVPEGTLTSTLSTRLRHQIWGSLVAWVAIIGLSHLGCDNAYESLKQPTESAPRQTLKSFSTSHAEAGIKKWTLVGNGATFLKDRIEVQQPKVQIFRNGKLTINLTGDRGEIIQRSNDIQLFDNVVGVNSDGQLFTDELHWQNRHEKLFAPHESRIVRGDSTLVGIELEADPSLETILMKSTRFNLYAKDEKVNELHQ